MSSQIAHAATLAGPIAYLTGEYPKVSHTFIQREVAALRAHGAEVLTCTVRRAAPRHVGSDQKAEEAATFCILETAKHPARLLSAHLGMLARDPRRWLSALGLAWRTRPPGARALLYQLFYFAEAAVLARHLRRNKVVHLHNHFANSSCSVAMLTSEMSGIPFSFTEHGPAIFFEPKHWRIDEKVARARHVVCISHFCRSQMMLFSDRRHWPRMAIVHCGVRPENYAGDGGGRDGRHVIFVGRLDAVKGGPLLLDAFARIRDQHLNARVTVVGDGPARPALEAQAREQGLADAVTFAGFRTEDEVAALLQEADLLVLPSFAEGVPVVLMEAMASGIPVIASRVAGIPELVEDGLTGYLVPPGDPAALSDRLDALLRDADLRQRMGQAGREAVAADFDVAKEAAFLLRILSGAVPPGQLRPPHPGQG